MADITDTSALGNVCESPLAIILEEEIAHSHRSHEQVGISVVVEIGKAPGHTDPLRDAQTSLLGDLFEPSPPDIAPELIAADLTQKIDVMSTVTVDISYQQAVAVIVVNRFESHRGVFGHLMHKVDSACIDLIGEREIGFQIG